MTDQPPAARTHEGPESASRGPDYRIPSTSAHHAHLPTLVLIMVVHSFAALMYGIATLRSLTSSSSMAALGVMFFTPPALLLLLLSIGLARRHRWMPGIMITIYGLNGLVGLILGIVRYHTPRNPLGQIFRNSVEEFSAAGLGIASSRWMWRQCDGLGMIVSTGIVVYFCLPHVRAACRRGT